MKIIVERNAKGIIEGIEADVNRVVELIVADRQGRLMIEPSNSNEEDVFIVRSDIPTKCIRCAHIPVCEYFSNRFNLNLDKECTDNCALYLFESKGE